MSNICEGQNRLIIYANDGANTVMVDRCVNVATIGNPVVINRNSSNPIILPVGSYTAELITPHTDDQLLGGRPNTVLVEEFQVWSIPTVNYHVETVEQEGGWINQVTYQITGKIIDDVTYTDNFGNQLTIKDSPTPEFPTGKIFNVTFNNPAINTLVANFRVNEIRLFDGTILFDNIPISTITYALPKAGGPHLIGRDITGNRILIGERELVWNIIYQDNTVIIDTRDSIAHYIEIEVDGEFLKNENGQVIQFPLGFHHVDLTCYSQVDADQRYSRHLIKVSARILGSEVRDTLEVHHLTSLDYCNPSVAPPRRDEEVVYELRIRKEKSEEYEKGHTEYLDPGFDGKQQPLTGPTTSIWDDKYPFTRIRPCWVRDDGYVEAYLDRNNFCQVAELTYGSEVPGMSGSNDCNSPIRDYLKRTDGNIMVEFPNLWYNSFETENWVYVQISPLDPRNPEPGVRERIADKPTHWLPTNVRSGIIHDTIYLGAFYSNVFERTIDSVDYAYFNSNFFDDNYLVTSDDGTLEDGLDLNSEDRTRKYLFGIQGLDKIGGQRGPFDVLSIQNVILLRLLQIFRFCYSDNLQIGNLTNGGVISKSYNEDAYNYQKKFACLDYPFGFGVEEREGERIVRMPAVFNAHYDISARGTAIRTADDMARTYSGYPIHGFVTLDDGLQAVTLFTNHNGQAEKVICSKVSEYISRGGWTKPSGVLSMTESSITNGDTMPLLVTPNDSNNGFEASFGHVTSQNRTLYTEEEINRQNPQPLVDPSNYHLLYRPVWWKKNETYVLNVKCTQTLYALPNTTTPLIVETTSTGWKQIIDINGQTKTKNRINRPFHNADHLTDEMRVLFRIGRYPVKVSLYDTNNLLKEEKEIEVHIVDPYEFIDIDKKVIWNNEVFTIRLYSENGEDLIFDNLLIAYHYNDGTIIELDTISRSTARTFTLRPTQSGTINITITGEASPSGITVQFPVLVNENYIVVEPTAVQSDTNFIDRRILHNGMWQVLGQMNPRGHAHQFIGFHCTFNVIETTSQAVLFRTYQPQEGVARETPIPNGFTEGEDDHGRYLEREFSGNTFSHIFPYGNGRDYEIQFISQRVGIDAPAAIQRMRVICIDPSNPYDAVAELHYDWTLSRDGILSITFEKHEKKTKGQRVIINWGDGVQSEPYLLIDARDNSFIDPFGPKRHQYVEDKPAFITILVEGAYGTSAIESFFVQGISPVYTVRIYEPPLHREGLNRTSQNSQIKVSYPDNLDECRILDTAFINNATGADFDRVYPFDSIDPVLMDGTRVTHYLNHNNWSINDTGQELSSAILGGQNVMIEIPPFYYKITKTDIVPLADALNESAFIDVSICSEKVDDTWQAIHPNGHRECVYIGAFLKSVVGEGEQRDLVSVRGSEDYRTRIKVSKDIAQVGPHNPNSSYESVDYHIWQSIQVLFLMRYGTVDSSSVFRGDNPQVATNQNNSLEGGMSGTDNHVRIFGLDNLWGFRPTLLSGIRYENGAFVIEGASKIYPLPINTYMNRPVITRVVGNNEAGFLPIGYEGFPEERYRDVVKVNGSKEVFAGIPTYLHTETGVDYQDNGIFSIGNRTKNIDGSFVEYFTERFMVKPALEVDNSTYIRKGHLVQYPLNCIYITNADANPALRDRYRALQEELASNGQDLDNERIEAIRQELRTLKWSVSDLNVTLENDRAYRYVLWDRMEGVTQEDLSNRIRPVSFTRTYNRPQPASDDAPLKVIVYTMDKLLSIKHEHKTHVWIRGLDADIDISPDTFTINDPVVVDARKLQEHPDGPFAESITVKWGITRKNPSYSSNNTNSEEWIEVEETRYLGEDWKFVYSYGLDYDPEEHAGIGVYEITVEVDGGQYSNGGTYKKQIFLGGHSCWYTFGTIAGYAESIILGVGSGRDEIDEHGFLMQADFSPSEGQYMTFQDDHELTLGSLDDKYDKNGVRIRTKDLTFKHQMFGQRLMPIRWDENGDLEPHQLIDTFIEWDGPVHKLEREPAEERGSDNRRVLDYREYVVDENPHSLTYNQIIRNPYFNSNTGAERVPHKAIFQFEDWNIEHLYQHPGIYYPRFVMWGNERTVEATMRIVALGIGESLPNVEEIEWERNTERSYEEDPSGYQTLNIILPDYDKYKPYARTLHIDWGDGTGVQFNPSGVATGWVDANRTEYILAITEENDPARPTPLKADIRITTSRNSIDNDEQPTIISEQQSGIYAFTFGAIEEFMDWVNITFTHVSASSSQSGQPLIGSGARDILFNSQIRLLDREGGESTIDVAIDWFTEVPSGEVDENDIPTLIRVPVDNMVPYKEDIVFKRDATFLNEEGHNGIFTRNFAFPPQHKYRWNGVFTVTITAYGDFGLVDSKYFRFNSFPIYGFAVMDGANRLDQSEVRMLYDAMQGSLKLTANQWNDIFMFKNVRAVLFNPKADPQVRCQINPNDYYEGWETDSRGRLVLNEDGEPIRRSILSEVTGEYFEEARLAIRKRRIADYIKGEVNNDGSLVMRDDGCPVRPPMPECKAIEQVDREMATECISDHPEFQGDVMIEVPNLYFNMYRSIVPAFYESKYRLVTNQFEEVRIKNCLVVETSERKLEPGWGSTCRDQSITRGRSYISAYHGSFGHCWEGMRSLALKAYWRESFDGVQREARRNGYDLMRWNHATFLQLLLILRTGGMAGTVLGTGSRDWGDLGNWNVVRSGHGLFPVRAASGSGGTGSYKFCGILEPASATMGSWIEGLRVSDKHFLFKEKITGRELSIDPCDPCHAIDPLNDLCDISPIREHFGFLSNTGDKIPLILGINLDPNSGNVLAWTVEQTDNPGATINSSFFLPKHFVYSQLRYKSPCPIPPECPQPPTDPCGFYPEDACEWLIDKQWFLRPGSYMGDNNWAFFPAADIIGPMDPNVCKFFKWGSGIEGAPNFFSGINVTNRGGPDETSMDIANQGDYTLFTYNDTEIIGDSSISYRTFDFIARPLPERTPPPVRVWMNDNHTKEVAFNIEIPSGQDYFMDDDTFTFIFGDVSTETPTGARTAVITLKQVTYWSSDAGEIRSNQSCNDIRYDGLTANQLGFNRPGLIIRLDGPPNIADDNQFYAMGVTCDVRIPGVTSEAQVNVNILNMRTLASSFERCYVVKNGIVRPGYNNIPIIDGGEVVAGPSDLNPLFNSSFAFTRHDSYHLVIAEPGANGFDSRDVQGNLNGRWAAFEFDFSWAFLGDIREPDRIDGLTKEEAITGSYTRIVDVEDPNTGIITPGERTFYTNFIYNYPGRYISNCIVLNKYGDRVEVLDIAGNRKDFKVQEIELFGVVIQTTLNPLREGDAGYHPNIMRYRALQGQMIIFYCQMSYGHRIEINYGDGSPIERDTLDLTSDDITAHWIFTHRYEKAGAFTATITVYQCDQDSEGNLLLDNNGNYIDIDSKSREVSLMISELRAAIDMQVALEYFYSVPAFILDDDDESTWFGEMIPNPIYDPSRRDEIAVTKPIWFRMMGSSPSPANISFYPDVARDEVTGAVLRDENDNVIADPASPPYIGIDATLQLQHAYQRPGNKLPMVVVTSGRNKAEATLAPGIRGVNSDGSIDIYAGRLKAWIEKLPALPGFGWTTEPLVFSVAKSEGVSIWESIVAVHESGLRTQLPTPDVNNRTQLGTDQLSGMPGLWTITATARGFNEDRDSHTIVVEVRMHNIELRAYPVSRDINGNVIEDYKIFDDNGEWTGEYVEQPAYVVSGMVPLEVMFIAPNTTTDFIDLRLDNTPGGTRIRVERTRENPNFEYLHTYNDVPGTYLPSASITIGPGNTLTNTTLITINVQGPILEIVSITPDSNVFQGDSVTVLVRSNAGRVTFDFDADPANIITNRRDYANPNDDRPGFVDSNTESVYFVLARNADDLFEVTHRYVEPGAPIYYIRVTTNTNSLVYDVQFTTTLRVDRTDNPAIPNPEGFPVLTAAFDKNESVGAWIELIPGDGRTIQDIIAGWEDLTEEEQGLELLNRGIKLVQINGIPNSVIYFKNNFTGINGRPWVFTVDGYGNSDQTETIKYDYKTWVYPRQPEEPALDEDYNPIQYGGVLQAGQVIVHPVRAILSAIYDVAEGGSLHVPFTVQLYPWTWAGEEIETISSGDIMTLTIRNENGDVVFVPVQQTGNPLTWEIPPYRIVRPGAYTATLVVAGGTTAKEYVLEFRAHPIAPEDSAKLVVRAVKVAVLRVEDSIFDTDNTRGDQA